MRNSLGVRIGLLLVQSCVLILLATALSSTLRNNDQAAYISGAFQIARGAARSWAAPFYNYDKEYATYHIVAVLLDFFPKGDPVWLGNLLDLVLFGLSALSISLYRRRSILVPFAAFVPMILSPGLVLYAPFLGTSCVSYSILVCAFMLALLLPGRRGSLAAAPFVALAVASRADAILAMPAFILSIHSRQRIKSLIRDRAVLTLGLASAAPIVVGRLIFTGIPNSFADFFGFSTELKAFATLLVFSFGMGEVLLLLAIACIYSALIFKKKPWRMYYILTTLSMLIPIGFYSFQLYSPTYFFLELAVSLFFLLNRRTATLWVHFSEHSSHFCVMILTLSVALTLVPWAVGLHLPRLTQPRLTLRRSTTFPTSHGAFPMGAYGEFLWRLSEDRFLIDHNQRIWHSAESVDYRTCNNGDVPLADSPMVNYLELAVRLQHKTPAIIKDWKHAPCRFVYVDSRSVTRMDALSHYTNLRDVLNRRVTVASQGNDGQPILLVETSEPQSLEGVILSELRKFFGGRQFEIVFLSSARERVRFVPPYKYVIFSDGLSCGASSASKQLLAISSPGHLRLMWDGELANRPLSAIVFCPGAKIVGRAESVLPDYMF